MSRRPPSTLVALIAAVGVMALSGCGAASTNSPAAAAAGSTTAHPVISVVASTNVWGAVASEVGGDHVAVTSFISDPAQDPHSYEANTQNQLAVKQAGLVIENGGGYDDFMDTMLKAAGTSPKLVNAVAVSGKTASGGGDLNEHVWYDLPTVAKVAQQIANELSSLDAANGPQFTKNANAFVASLTPLTDAVTAIKAKHGGTGVAITEPVPGYLLDAAGLVNKTPDEFSKAIEEGTDVAAAVLNETLNLFSSKQVAALVYNEQTTGAPTEAVKKAATDANIPVVPVTETLPEGGTYTPWMSNQISALSKALGGTS